MEDEKDLQNPENETENEGKATPLPDSEKLSVSDLIAERDSLKEELATRNAELEAIKEELHETKKLNFQLGRTIGAGKTSEQQATEALSNMFKQIR